MKHSARYIANQFIKHGFEKLDRPLTALSVMKLVYLAHAWNLAWYDQPLVEGRFEAWKLGPVHIDLRSATRPYGAEPITELLELGFERVRTDRGARWQRVKAPPLTDEENDTIYSVFDNYARTNPIELAYLTHDEAWRKARRRRNKVLKDPEIQKCYQAKLDREAS
ncbi:MAG: DUF4065 domain-containing protein [bacterium]|nr:DUF4065 domain-containing protein [bacterium]